jgi:hypothetical protein
LNTQWANQDLAKALWTQIKTFPSSTAAACNLIGCYFTTSGQMMIVFRLLVEYFKVRSTVKVCNLRVFCVEPIAKILSSHLQRNIKV